MPSESTPKQSDAPIRAELDLKGREILEIRRPSAHIAYGKQELPPMWVDMQEQVNENLDELSRMMGLLRDMQSRRVMASFDEKEVARLD